MREDSRGNLLSEPRHTRYREGASRVERQFTRRTAPIQSRLGRYAYIAAPAWTSVGAAEWLLSGAWHPKAASLLSTPHRPFGKVATNGGNGALYGRLSVGKGFFESFCICWLVRPCIRPVGAAFHVPLAIMPFARLRSRSFPRTRSARPQWVFLIRRFQPALCISSCPPFPTSSAIARLVSFYAMAGSL